MTCAAVTVAVEMAKCERAEEVECVRPLGKDKVAARLPAAAAAAFTQVFTAYRTNMMMMMRRRRGSVMWLLPLLLPLPPDQEILKTRVAFCCTVYACKVPLALPAKSCL